MRPFVAAAVAVVALAGCGGDDAPSTESAPEAGGASVTIKTFQFEPDPITVEPGTTITFSNEDKIDHTVTAGTREAPTPDVFDGQLPEQGATFDLVLDEAGTYDYFCAIHNGMAGQVVVE